MQDGPTHKKAVESLFEKAKQSAPGITREEFERERAERARKDGFKGSGHTLGDGVRPSQPVGPTAEPEGEAFIDIAFYRNGFVVGDGPLRAFDDPANREFLEAINKGRVPAELGNRDVSISLLDNRNKDYVAPVKKPQPFGGSGMRLGSTAGPATAATTTTTTTTTAAATTAPATAASPAMPDPDPAGGEVTSIQLRLHDGTRLVAKFYVTQTVGDIRKFVDNSRPECKTMPYDLIVPFPPPRKLLTDNSITIEAAGLKAAAIVQAKK